MRRTSVRGEEAQAIVEFGIVITFLLLLFLGTIDFSRFIYYDSAIRSAARVGAEVAGNYCNMPGCGNQSSPTSDNLVMQATYCEATQNTLMSGLAAVSLSPSTSCTPCTTSTCNPCPTAASSCPPCVKDICISPSGTRTSGSDVTVYVGYNFTPVSPYLSSFFPAQSCYTGDSTSTNHHTLCASMVGRVSEH